MKKPNEEKTERTTPMTARERMLAASLNQLPDSVPVSPELWDATTFEVNEHPWHELVGPFAKYSWWQEHLKTFEFFKTDAWILADAPMPNPPGCESQAESEWIGPEEIETRIIYRTPKGTLQAVTRTTPIYANWQIKHPVLKFPEDMQILEPKLFPDPSRLDPAVADEVIDGVGEKGLVEVGIGDFFTSMLAHWREGGYAAVINDLLDYPDYCRELQKRFVEFQRAYAEEICRRTKVQALFVNSGYSGIPITSPTYYREWDMPALTAVGEVAKKYGVSLHVHQHGHTAVIAEDLIKAGVTVVCPMLEPPQGDVSDLADFKRRFGDRLAFKGNINPFGVLKTGTPEQVEAEVKACIEAGAPGGGFILGTQDSTLAGTPIENIHAMVAAGRKYGRYNSDGSLKPAE